MPIRPSVLCVVSVLCVLSPLAAQTAQTPAPPPLLPEPVVRALAAEVSGTSARRTVQELTLQHRMRGSRGFRAAAERVRDRLKESGLAEVEILQLPADGKIFYGTQRSRPAWDADFAELWEQENEAGGWRDTVRVASWEARPVTLAQDSASGEVAADLVDVGAGTADSNYAFKDVRGRLALVSAQPGAAYPLAVEKYGAAGLVSYAQNQVTAWWKEDETLVRWGHLATFPAPKTFAFMVSLKQARAWQERLAHDGTVHLRASVKAGQHPGSYDIATGILPGADPARRGEEIVLSCHLDHLRPGANDNASGCSAILEVARTLAKLIREGKIAPPPRTIRFVFPPEIEGTISLLNAHPEIARRAKAVIHMDMVGGDAGITKAVFHVTRSPKSLPTFVNDVGEAFGRFINDQSFAFAATGAAPFPLVDPEGSKGALQAEVVDYTEGSDHQVWTEGSWRVPAIYLTGRTVTSIPTPTRCRTSTPPSCCAPPSSARRAPTIWPASTPPASRTSGKRSAATAWSAPLRPWPAALGCATRDRRRPGTTCCVSTSLTRRGWWPRWPASPTCRPPSGNPPRRSLPVCASWWGRARPPCP
jgi:aminopeptidase YwaD